MKKIMVTVLCSLMLIGISIATDDWVPYEFEENGVTSGFSTEVIQAVMQLIALA